MQADMRPIEPPRDLEPLRRTFRFTPQMALGAIIVAFGLVLLADNVGMADADRVLRFWPLGLVAVGVLKLFQGPGRSSRVLGGFLVVGGLLLSAEHILGMPIDFDDWWPLVLIGFGILILSRSRHGARTRDGATASREETISEFATWAAKQRRVATSSFRGADLTAIMGGIELDLRGAGTATGEAVVDVFVMWGGVEIWVPPDWAVSNEVSLLMGGAEDKSTGTQDARHRLIIRGFVLMGGLEIKI
jgi:predicted membrane protein